MQLKSCMVESLQIITHSATVNDDLQVIYTMSVSFLLSSNNFYDFRQSWCFQLHLLTQVCSILVWEQKLFLDIVITAHFICFKCSMFFSWLCVTAKQSLLIAVSNKNQVFERGMIQILDQSKASVSKLFSITTTAIRHAMSEKQCTKSGYLKNRH